MSDPIDQLYSFAFRGFLAEESLDRDGRINRQILGLNDQEIAKSVGLHLLDDVLVENSQKMAIVYTAIAAFENSVRDFVKTALIDKYQADWWEKGFSNTTRERAEKRIEDEQKTKWHTQRGRDPINYTTFGDLKNAMRTNWDAFEDAITSLEWAGGIFDAIERSRNVIMHSGVLDPEDIARLGINIRDWVKQVGA